MIRYKTIVFRVSVKKCPWGEGGREKWSLGRYPPRCTLPHCTVPLKVAARSTLSLFIFTRMNFSSASSQILWSEQQDGNMVTSTGAKQMDHKVKLIGQICNHVPVPAVCAKVLSCFFSFDYLQTYICRAAVEKNTWIITIYEFIIIWDQNFWYHMVL